MITRSQSGIVKPIDYLSLHTFLISPIPKNLSDALKDSQWRNAIYDEYNALVKNDTRLLVPRPAVVSNLLLILIRHLARLSKPTTICTVFSLVVSRKWPIHQLDVKNTFLNDDLSKTVYMHQPPGFVDASRCDSSLLIYRQGSHVAYLLLYVDDIILTASSTTLLQHLIDSLHREFDMTDLGALNYFLGISAICHSTESKLGPDGVLIQDPTLYQSLAGGLQYLTFRCLDLSFVVQQICLYMHDPRKPHLATLKRILRYVQGTLDLGLQLYASSTTSLVGYTDADWTGCPSTRMSTSETAWLRNLLLELHSPLSTATLAYSDNVRVLNVPSHFQYADIFTKGPPFALFEEFRSSLSVRPPPAPTAGEY
nr:hypothetical protein [Tanacetum cinerariifolium]